MTEFASAFKSQLLAQVLVFAVYVAILRLSEKR